ncbi:MAG: hypothetical protein QM764_05210 [Chitinophagaceae bacterium]
MLTIEKKSLKVGKFVNTEHVDSVIRTYKQERWVHNTERLGKEDSLSVWHSIEELEELLAKAKEHGGDGIRFYFAAYPKNYVQPLYAGRQTIVMVATKQKETETGLANKDIYVNTEKGTEILAFNTGTICPPFCKPKGGGASDEEIGITIIDKGQDGIVVI